MNALYSITLLCTLLLYYSIVLVLVVGGRGGCSLRSDMAMNIINNISVLD